jgi:plastocyanin
MSLRGRGLLLMALLGLAMAVLPAIAISGTNPTIEAVNEGSGIYGQHHHWSPAQASVGAGGIVTLSNPTEVDHGVEWRSGPETPTCGKGVPVGSTPIASGKQWTGTCEFAKPGRYTFYCTVHGPEMTGTVTVAGTPTASTEPPAPVAQTEATLNGAVKPEGNATSYYFEYGATAGFGQRTPELTVASDFATHHLSATLTGLAPATEYHVQLVVVYGVGATKLEGGETVLMTKSVAAPSVTTRQASSVSETGVTLNGSVSPEGLETTYFFKYGLSTSYESATSTEHTGPEGVGHAALASLTGLLPNTLYHFRLFAKNALDASAPVEGEDQTFTTSSPQPSPPPSTTTTTTTPATAPPTTTPAFITPVPPPLREEPPIGSLAKLAAIQHGQTVHGAIDVSQAGAGARLEVALFAADASRGKARHVNKVRVGRLSLSPLKAGLVSFTVPLTARARSALRHQRRLVLTVQIVLAPMHGMAVTVTRQVVLHAG